jgi:uncharacterized protein (UPF0332 family)
MRPDDLVASAKFLLDKPSPTEADCRIAVHACYYAMLHVAGSYLGIDVAAAPDRHKAAMMGLQNRMMPNKRVVALRKGFANAQRLRIRADYRIDAMVSTDDAEDVVEWARGVLAQPV